MPLPKVANLFSLREGPEGEETFTPLLHGGHFEMEEIISRGAASPGDFWYDQERDEWVMLARGEAVLRFDDGDLPLKAGDHLTIPAGMRHRVESTSADAVWLAVHFRG